MRNIRRQNKNKFVYIIPIILFFYILYQILNRETTINYPNLIIDVILFILSFSTCLGWIQLGKGGTSAFRIHASCGGMGFPLVRCQSAFRAAKILCRERMVVQAMGLWFSGRILFRHRYVVYCNDRPGNRQEEITW